MREIIERVHQITRENEKLFEQLIAGERRFRGLAKAVWKVQEEERRRLARELHDGIGQTLTALKNQLEWVQRRAAAGEPGLETEIAESVDLAAQALNDTRELSRLLRPPVLDDLGLVPALRWLARTLGQRTGLEVELETREVEERLDPDLETLVFRAVQEALTNVLKHSGAKRARVSLARRAAGLRLRVVDEGRGFDSATVLGSSDGAAGSGLRGMQDRVELFGGRIRIESQPQRGTSVTIDLPVENSLEPPSP